MSYLPFLQLSGDAIGCFIWIKSYKMKLYIHKTEPNPLFDLKSIILNILLY